MTEEWTGVRKAKGTEGKGARKAKGMAAECAMPCCEIPKWGCGVARAESLDDKGKARIYPLPMYPRREYHFWVYIMASRSLQLYVGMTTSLKRRVEEHRAHLPGSYTARYNIDRLVYFEHYQYVHSAIARENELKDWNRAKKLALITASNPTWIDLSEAWRNADSSASLPNGKG